MTPTELQNLVQFVALDRLPFALVVVALGWVALLSSSRVLDDLGERFVDRRLLFKQAKALTRFALYLAIPAIVLSSVLRLEAEVLLAVAGTISVAVGFAFKDLLGSLLAGVILLIDRPFQVGDRVRFGSWYGEVVEMGLRSVRLLTLDESLVTIPNGKFLTDEVASLSAGELSAQITLPFYVAAAEDFDRAREIVAEATTTSRYVHIDRPVLFLVEDRFLGERFVTVITSKAHVFDVRFEQEYATDVTERVKRAFRAAGIRTPDLAYRDVGLFGGREIPITPGSAPAEACAPAVAGLHMGGPTPREKFPGPDREPG